MVSKASLGEWLRFVKDIVFGALGRYTHHSAPDARTDACCVYTQADVEHAIRKYGYRPDQVIAVGNPDLSRFGLATELIGSRLGSADDQLTDVMYIDTGLIYTGWVFQSPQQFIRHLVDTKEQVSKFGKRLLFKPHPDHLRTDMPSVLSAAGIQICSNEDLVPRLRECCACIVEPSTLSLVPALMGLPLFLAQYGKLAEQQYGKVLVSYPRAYKLTNLAKFDALLSKATKSCDVVATRDWIDQNSGPLPATEMPNRVADVVINIIAPHHAETGVNKQSLP